MHWSAMLILVWVVSGGRLVANRNIVVGLCLIDRRE
jgi:hypothetical protein